MVSFVPVDPANIPRTRAGRRGRVAYPIIKSFMESNNLCVKLDTEGTQQKQTSLRACLNSYIVNHDMPVKVFSSNGDLYLMRLDMDEEGNIDTDWKGVEYGTEGAQQPKSAHPTPRPITPEEVEARFAKEGKDTTK